MRISDCLECKKLAEDYIQAANLVGSIMRSRYLIVEKLSHHLTTKHTHAEIVDHLIVLMAMTKRG